MTKVCVRCGVEKSTDDFYKSKTSKDGFFAWCKPCKADHRKQSYASNKEREYKLHREWVVNNQERRTAQNVKATQKWVETHRAQVRQTKRRYKLKRTEWELNGSFTQQEWNELVDTYGSMCLRCRAVGVELTQDHVIPLSKGGTNLIINIQPLCGPCNSAKGTKDTDYR